MYLKLQNIDHKIIYYQCVKNKTADLLSRPAIASCKTIDVNIEIDWAEEQDNDKELAIVKVNLKASNNSSEYRGLDNFEFWPQNRDFLYLAKNFLYFKSKDDGAVIVVPSHLRKKILPLYHDSLTAGHLGFEKIFAAISARFYWPQMKSEIYEYCNICQKQKPKRHH